MKITGIARIIHCPDCGVEITAEYRWTGGPNLKGNDLSSYLGKCSCGTKVALVVNAGDEEHHEYILSVVELAITPFGEEAENEKV